MRSNLIVSSEQHGSPSNIGCSFSEPKWISDVSLYYPTSALVEWVIPNIQEKSSPKSLGPHIWSSSLVHRKPLRYQLASWSITWVAPLSIPQWEYNVIYLNLFCCCIFSELWIICLTTNITFFRIIGELLYL